MMSFRRLFSRENDGFLEFFFERERFGVANNSFCHFFKKISVRKYSLIPKSGTVAKTSRSSCANASKKYLFRGKCVGKGP
jgi:hypothetical protein